MKDNIAFLTYFNLALGIENEVANWIVTMGGKAFLYPKKLRPSSDIRQQFRDTGDVAILRHNGIHRVEVKSTTVDFTTADTWPFNYGLFVDECYHVDNVPSEMDPLYAYVVVSSNKTHIAVIKASTKPHWTIKRDVYDRAQQRKCDMYVCPVSHAKFGRMQP